MGIASLVLVGTTVRALDKTELLAVDVGSFCPLPNAGTGPARKQSDAVPADLPAGAGIEMVAPRGGRVMAQAVLRGPALANVAAQPPQLVGPGGATLPAGAVTLHWLTGPARGDVIVAKPVEKQTQPLLVMVEVPATAAPGMYHGTLTVTAQGFTGSLKVQLNVTGWTLPPPRDWQTICGMMHSPDTIAMHYKVEPWSDAHLKLMEPSLKLLADLGVKSTVLHLVAEGPMHERQSMVRWLERGGFDCAPLDRYLDLWEKTCGPPTTVTLSVWHNRTRFKPLATDHQFRVTRQKADGTLENIGAPGYSQPGAVGFWKPAFAAVRERLAKRGWRQTEVLLGLPYDSRPTEEEIATFQEIAPGLRWRIFTHGFNMPLPGADGKLMLPDGGEVGWLVGCDTMLFRGPSAPERTGMLRNAGMKRQYPFTMFPRYQLWGHVQPWAWRDIAPANVQRGGQGLSEMGLDFWGGDWKVRSRNGNLSDVNCDSPRHDAAMSMTAPGPRGAEPTLRYLMLREGLQATEAFLALRRAGEKGNARAAAAAEAFREFMQTRTDNFFGHIPWGKAMDQAPATYIHDLYKPDYLKDAIADRRKVHPGKRLVVVACDRGTRPEVLAPMGAAAATADAVVLTDWGKPHANFDEVITAMRAGVPANVPCEVVRDRQAAIQRARVLAGKEGVVVVCSKGDEAYALFDQERSQTAWNAAIRDLYTAAATAR
jgi:hypothetical protein